MKKIITLALLAQFALVSPAFAAASKVKDDAKTQTVSDEVKEELSKFKEEKERLFAEFKEKKDSLKEELKTKRITRRKRLVIK
jgi:ABC-type transporter MlaC component